MLAFDFNSLLYEYNWTYAIADVNKNGYEEVISTIFDLISQCV